MVGISSSFLALLRCPSTGQQLRLATPKELLALKKTSEETFLVREDGSAAYLVGKNIPNLLANDAIPLSVTA